MFTSSRYIRQQILDPSLLCFFYCPLFPSWCEPSASCRFLNRFCWPHNLLLTQEPKFEVRAVHYTFPLLKIFLWFPITCWITAKILALQGPLGLAPKSPHSPSHFHWLFPQSRMFPPAYSFVAPSFPNPTLWNIACSLRFQLSHSFLLPSFIFFRAPITFWNYLLICLPVY